MRVVLLSDDGSLHDVEVDGPALTHVRDGKTYDRFEIRNPIDDSTKGYVYASALPSGPVLARIHEMLTGRRYGESCPICRKAVDISEDVMPWQTIEEVPHIAHTKCVGEYRARREAAERQATQEPGSMI